MGGTMEVVEDGEQSWKVRRAGAKALAACITHRSSERHARFGEIFNALKKRFCERETRAKIEVVRTLLALVNLCSVEEPKSLQRQVSDPLVAPSLFRQRTNTQNLMHVYGDISTLVVVELAKDDIDADIQTVLLSLAKQLLYVASASESRTDGVVYVDGLQDTFKDLFPAL
eukprot:UN29025